MEALFFNVDSGFLEAIVRGYKAGILSQNQYANLTQCATLEDLRTQLSATDYGNFLANEPLPLSASTIADKATRVLLHQFNFMRNSAATPLGNFFEYITYGYMIDNVILMITGTLHQRSTTELMDRCHPLGMFDTLPSLGAATSVQDMYQTALVETPLAPYFRGCLDAKALDELNIELVRNLVYKAYLEDFYEFCTSLGSPTSDVMHKILAFEADRRTLNVTVNSLGTSLKSEQRAALFPKIGRLYPAGNNILAGATDLEQVRQACEGISEYHVFFSDSGRGTGSSSDDLAAALEDHFFRMEVQLNKDSFLQQFQYGVFYSYTKLKEQEIRNLTWISECIAQDAKDRIQDFIPIF